MPVTMAREAARGRLEAPRGALEQFAPISLVAFVLWAMIAGLLNDRPLRLGSPFAYAPVCLALGVVVGRWMARRWSIHSQVLALILIASWVLLVLGSAGAGAPPLGYANANAAFAIQLVALCGLVALRARGTMRWLVVVIAIPLALVPLLSLSKAAVLVGIPAYLAVLLALTGRVKRRWWSVTVGAAATLAGALLVTWLAALATWPSAANAAFSSVRHELWGDALDLWSQRPVVGSGSGSFQVFSALAADPDTATVHSLSLIHI